MDIKITAKQLGKKHPLLQEKIFKIKELEQFCSLKDLLEAIVEQQVNQYNHKDREKENSGKTKMPKDNYLPLLTDTGKIGFNVTYNLNKADIEKAKEQTIQAFEDGLFAVFWDEEELTNLNQQIEITLDKTLTFIRLTFLAGSYW